MKAVLRLWLFVCMSAGLLASGSIQPTVLTGPAAPGPEKHLPSPQSPASLTRYKTLSGLDFRPLDSSISYALTENGSLYPVSPSTGPQFTASLDLPGGASVTDITFYFVDNATPDIQFRASFFNPSNGNSFDACNITTFGFPRLTTIQAISFSASSGSFVIDNSNYSYQLLINFSAFDGSQALYGARITYTEPDVPVPDQDVTFVGIDFRPTSSGLKYNSNGMNLYATTLCAGCSFIAPLNLPQSTLVTGIDYIVVDNNDTYNLTLQVNRFNPQTGELTVLASAATSGGPQTTPQTVSVSGNLFIIDNTTYSYAISIQTFMTSMEHQIVGVRVHFTPGPAANFQEHTYAGYEFQANLSNVDFDNLGGAIFPEANGQAGPFTLNLDLPDGDVVYSLVFYFKKTSGATGNLTFSAKSWIPGLGTWELLETGGTGSYSAGDSVAGLSFAATVALLGTMDTQAENLRLGATPSAGDPHLMLYGAQVQYFSPTETFLPLIQQN